MSKREDRLSKRAAELRTREYVAQIRLSNAERGLGTLTTRDARQVVDAFTADVDAARTALREIHGEQQEIITQLDRHTTDMADMALIMVEAPDGCRVFERRDPDNTGDDDTNWYHLEDHNDAPPMTFDEITGALHTDADGVERHHTYTFYRLYTAEEVDNLIDQALGL